MPLFLTPPSVITIEDSVQSNAKLLNDAHLDSINELKTLKHIIESIDAIGCMECWIHGEPIIGAHDHNRPPYFNAVVSSFCASTRKDNAYWPYCFRCWIPFHEPCLHQSIPRGVSNTGSFCRYHDRFPSMIPSLVALIATHPSSGEFLQQISRAVDAPFTNFESINELRQWLTADPEGPNTIPNCHRFVIAFDREFHK